MSYPVISVENLSKSYRLGQIGTGTLTNDLKVWWAKKRGLPNPLLKIGQTDHGNRDGETLWALRDVSFTVQQGEVLGIIGRNGAGKSTLLKILSRVTAPTSGCVKVKGRIASLLEVGTGFHPELTGRENIYLNGAILGMSRQEIARKFDEIVAFAEVEKFIDTPVKRYSSGMYVRLAFAVAAHLESEILLVDEVLAVGDAEFQKKCLGKMGDVASKEGRTVLFVSHNMAAVSALCKSSILIDKGIIIERGTTNKIIQLYSNHTIIPSSDTLSDRTDREGNGDVKIVNLSLFNRFGEPIDSTFSGDEVNFEISYSSEKDESLQNVIFEIKITDQYDQILTTFSTFLAGQNFNHLPPKGTVYCHIPNFSLAPGKYYTQLICYVNNVLTDHIKNAVSIAVNEMDYYGSGRRIRSHIYGPMLMKQNWNEKLVKNEY